MNNSDHKNQKQAEIDAELDAIAVEERRKLALNMWERIEECGVNEDVKDILHRIAEAVGLEE